MNGKHTLKRRDTVSNSNVRFAQELFDLTGFS